MVVFVHSIRELLSFADDLEIDIPKIYDNLAEVFAPLMQDNKVLPLNFMQSCCRPLVDQGNKKEAVLITKVLAKAADYKVIESFYSQKSFRENTEFIWLFYFSIFTLETIVSDYLEVT